MERAKLFRRDKILPHNGTCAQRALINAVAAELESIVGRLGAPWRPPPRHLPLFITPPTRSRSVMALLLKYRLVRQCGVMNLLKSSSKAALCDLLVNLGTIKV